MWQIAPGYVPGMRVPVRLYASPQLLRLLLEEVEKVRDFLPTLGRKAWQSPRGSIVHLANSSCCRAAQCRSPLSCPGCILRPLQAQPGGFLPALQQLANVATLPGAPMPFECRGVLDHCWTKRRCTSSMHVQPVMCCGAATTLAGHSLRNEACLSSCCQMACRHCGRLHWHARPSQRGELGGLGRWLGVGRRCLLLPPTSLHSCVRAVQAAGGSSVPHGIACTHPD